ncbi:MAG: RluA family pseudouridine synthase [Thermodesulfobacteriota bacterium]|nr:RluA family pseudouridine synthase [Thermodesulfobacteriota bacterium]
MPMDDPDKAPDASPARADTFTITADQSHADTRLDMMVAVSRGCSRKLAASLIKNGDILVDERQAKPAHRVTPGETISGVILARPEFLPAAEPIPLDILLEDDDLLVINKAPGMIVHPAAGHFSGTLVNALLHHYPEIAQVGDPTRPGIVHRLDRYTSGILVIARNPEAHERLTLMFKERAVAKTYLALVYGTMASAEGGIDLPIGRHPTHRKKMGVVGDNAMRDARTLWRTRKRFPDATFLELDIKTGRTHQIRVHCTALGHPVVGDPLYTKRWTGKQRHFSSRAAFESLSTAPRQMLHAWRIAFNHPIKDVPIALSTPLARDFQQLLIKLHQSK